MAINYAKIFNRRATPQSQPIPGSTQVRNSGGGYSWFGNSRENKLTTWANDPVTDMPSEGLYLFDSDTGETFSPFFGLTHDRSDHWVQHFKATLKLTVGGQSLTAALDGQFDFTTLQTVLNGVVLDGWLSGAQIHEEGKVTGFSPLTFVGTVMVMRGSAN